MKNVGIPLAGILFLGNRKGCPYKNDIATQPLKGKVRMGMGLVFATC